MASYLSFSDTFYFKVLLPFVVLDAGLNMKVITRTSHCAGLRGVRVVTLTASRSTPAAT